ncbi:alkaline phosphatase D family protein [Sinomicrobium weinanense]|uniref:Alkaline phosphatase family protein n=1 Tax=Sinomicrobium weinanense TaxID=2842200 RepID=A0A926Q4G3_9FLAO|nr:alkaline phosphatase D family protein [Sinomicrobium weinanense]MBC9797051.1 alkaline phosphatase family protein [Sinomicrobium weinanense]MBU3122046.1 alkaline phosphatase family protein [Sinomicrobium weinanense]
MRRLFLWLPIICFLACQSVKQRPSVSEADYVIAFGSCNNQRFENVLWKEVLKNDPEIWIWGGDNIYSDTDDMNVMRQHYNNQLQQKEYREVMSRMKILGTWDDHDYGLNDGGEEFHAKKESQQLFLDFMSVDNDDPRRTQEGVYHAEEINTPEGNIKIIVLDTRYFRSALTDTKETGKRYQPNPQGEGTMLGKAQWQWLEKELSSSRADFNLIVSSIQFLSGEHGFEAWSNFPHEVDQLKQLIATSGAKGVIVLSGDRHISEFSRAPIEGLSYPLVDFTSSGLTHSYSDFTSEYNPHRVGKVVSDISFGLLRFDFDKKEVTMQIRGRENKVLGELVQGY